ncbi:hypothetical protein Vadar_028053 [Vaccinium darrowii]|uniref:Uncharacterized protein n=1 Tax=Vaccinium darrowii TaxID=229202 RepID=A0ACB7X4L9_9ERIC|nr:hypothetical protein Vadar_028053 [Vaccinium darrowii]
MKLVYYVGVMESPSSRAKGFGAKMDSNESESQSESSPRNADSHTFVDNNVNGNMERQGVQSIAEDDILDRVTDGEIMQMKFRTEDEAHFFYNSNDEILRESVLVVANHVDEGEVHRLYYLEHYACRECNWTVEYYPVDNQIKCCCLMFESFGLPCCHMISIMKYEHLLAIPDSLIMQRWTRRARPQQPIVGQISPSMTSMARYGILSSGYNLMSFYASHAHESFQHVRQVSHEMTSWMRDRWEKIPHVSTSRLEPICTIERSANLSLVREFFARIDRSTVDIVKERLMSVVRGVRIVVTPDALAKFGKFNRPLPNESRFPFSKGEKKPAWKEHVQKSPLGHATLGKSEGQSKLHQVSKCPNLATVEGNNDLLLSIHENISDAFDLLLDIKKRQAVKDDDESDVDDQEEEESETHGDESDGDDQESEPQDDDESESQSEGDDEDEDD